MRSIWVISPIIALGLTTSAPAQQQVDQNTKQQIEQMIVEYHDAWNNHNGAGIAALYTKDGIIVSQAPQVVKHGQQDIEQNYQRAFPTFPHHDSATATVPVVWTASGENNLRLIAGCWFHDAPKSNSCCVAAGCCEACGQPPTCGQDGGNA